MLFQSDGITDMNEFVPKVELLASLKARVEKKKAQFIASKLSGPAMDI